jgi:hypothetical protein
VYEVVPVLGYVAGDCSRGSPISLDPEAINEVPRCPVRMLWDQLNGELVGPRRSIMLLRKHGAEKVSS